MIRAAQYIPRKPHSASVEATFHYYSPKCPQMPQVGAAVGWGSRSQFYVSALFVEFWDLVVIGFSFDGRTSGLGAKWLASESGQEERDKILILSMIEECTELALSWQPPCIQFQGIKVRLRRSAKRDNGLKRGKCDSNSDI